MAEQMASRQVKSTGRLDAMAERMASRQTQSTVTTDEVMAALGGIPPASAAPKPVTTSDEVMSIFGSTIPTNTRQPARDLGQLWNNTVSNTQEIGQALGAMSSAGVQRLRQGLVGSVQKALNDSGDPYIANGLGLVQRYQTGDNVVGTKHRTLLPDSGDLQFAGQMFKAAGEDFNRDYVAPFAKPNYLGHTADLALTDPVTQFMNLAPVGSRIAGGVSANATKFATEIGAREAATLDRIMRLQRGITKAEQVASNPQQALSHTAVGGGAQPMSPQAATAALPKMQNALQNQRNVLHNIQRPGRILGKLQAPLRRLDDIMLGGKAARETLRIIAERDPLFRQYIDEMFKRVDDAYEAVPNKLRPLLVPAMERTDDIAAQAVYANPQARAFIDVARELTESAAERLKQASVLTDDQIRKALHEPRYLAEHPNLNAGKLNDPIHAVALKEMEARAGVTGEKPVYTGVVTKNDVVRGFKELNRPLGGAIEENPPWLVERSKARAQTLDIQSNGVPYRTQITSIRTADHSFHAGDLTKLRAAQAESFLQIQGALNDLRNNPAILNASGKLRAYDTRTLMGAAMKGAGAAQSQIDKFLRAMPEEAWVLNLPQQSINVIEAILRDSKNPFVGMYKNYKSLAQFWKKQVLGYNVFFPVSQFAQGGMVYGLSAYRGLHDMVDSTIALAVSFSPRAKQLTKDFMQGVGGRAYDASVLAAKNERGPLHAAVTFFSDTIPDLVLKKTTEADNIWRRPGWIYLAAKEWQRMNPADRLHWTQALNVTKRMEHLLQQAEKAKADPAIAARVGSKFIKLYGDYEEILGPLQGFVNDNIMWYRWLKHNATLVSTLPADNPFKIAFVNMLTKHAPEALQPDWIPDYMRRAGFIPFYDSDGNVALDADGVPLVVSGRGLSVLEQAPETLEVVAAMIAQGRGKSREGHVEVLPSGLALNPVLNTGLELTGRNSKTGLPFKRPDDMTAGSRGNLPMEAAAEIAATGQFDAEDVGVTGPPNIQKLLIRNFLPALDRVAAGLYEHPFTPSDFSTAPLPIPGLAEHAPKRINAGEQRKALPLVEILAGRSKPTQLPDKPENIQVGQDRQAKGILRTIPKRYANHEEFQRRLDDEVRRRLEGYATSP
jgi:hypothetical protein